MTCGSRRLVVAAPDKFRGTATAAQLAEAVTRAASAAGWACDEAPVADGGEGILEALGGVPRHAVVRGPLGDPVEAEWRVGTEGGDGDEGATVEMARASGLDLVGDAGNNDALRATTYGTGQLIAAAIDSGAPRIVVGMGGSATTDGGLGAISALRAGRIVHPGEPVGLPVEIVVACDVTTLFIDAAERFAPQKGATPAQVELLRRRLERLAQVYERDFGIDVRNLPGSGAAGGLAGGLAAALGATLVAGFDLVADEIDLAVRVANADLAVTGEGRLDEETFSGKAVGGVAAMAAEAGVPVLVVAGEVDVEVPASWRRAPNAVVSLVERFGSERAKADTLGCVETIVSEYLGWA